MTSFSLSHTEYNLIPIVFSTAAIPFSIFSGIMIDRVGNRFSISFFTVLSIIGLSIFCYGSDQNNPNFTLFLIGRGLFGMGWIGTIIWFSAMSSVWFHYCDMSLAASACLCFG